MQKPLKNIFLSVGILVVLCCLMFLLFYPATNGLGDSFTIWIIYILFRYIGLYGGLLLLLLRVLKIFRNPAVLLYVLIGTLNAAIGLLAVFAYVTKMADMLWLHISLLNLLISVLMLADAFLFKRDRS